MILKLLIPLFVFTLSISGQSMKLLNYQASNGIDYKLRHRVHLGNGSAEDKSFQHINSNYTKRDGKTSLPSSYNGQFLEIRKIKQSGTKKAGYRVYLICTGGPVNYWVEIEKAIEAGEVVNPEATKH